MDYTFNGRKESFCLLRKSASRFGRNSRHFSISIVTALLVCFIQASIANAGITFIGRSQQNNSSEANTTVTLNTPSGIVDGDLMLVFIVDYDSNPATPTNWTSLPAATNWIPYNIFAYYKFWHGGDPTSYTFGVVNNPKVVMRVYRGVASIDAVSPAPTMSGDYTEGTSFSLPALSPTVLASESYVAFYANDYSDDAINGPGDLTDTNTDQSGWSTFDGDKTIVNAGTTPPSETATIATASDWIGFDLTLEPTNELPTPTPIPSATPSATASPTSGVFPQFNLNGHLTQTYQPGGVWTRTLYQTDAAIGNSFHVDVPSFKQGGFTAIEQGVYHNPELDNWFTQSTFTLSAWHNNMLNQFWTPILNWMNANNFPVLGDYGDVGGTAPLDFLSWTNGPQTFTDMESYLTSQLVTGGPNIYAINGADEVGDAYGGEVGLSNLETILPALTANNPHIPVSAGSIQFQASPNFVEQMAALSDWTDIEQGSSYYNVNELIQNIDNGYDSGAPGPYGTQNQFPEILTGAGHLVPIVGLAYCMGVRFYKDPDGSTYGQDFVPGKDIVVGGGTPVGMEPGVMTDLVFYLEARGYAGYRSYLYDNPTTVATRVYATPAHNPPDGSDTQWNAGCSPAAARSNVYAGQPAPGNGQDRWLGLSAANNIIKAIEPYVLQPNITPPCPVSALPMICGAKSGNGGTLVTIVNFSVNSANFTFDPTPYEGTGSASWWQVTGGNQQIAGCGLNSSGAEDCGIGPTNINGTQWTSSSTTLPAAMAAPTISTVLNMQPFETDVFLYLQ